MTSRSAQSADELLSPAAVGRWLAHATRADPYGRNDVLQNATAFGACSLAADRQAVREARRFTRTTLDRWQLGPLVENAELIVSELLSNALRHGLDGSRRPAPPRPVWLGLLLREDSLQCTVCDHSTDVPVLKHPDHLAQSGRGLHIVDSLSEEWGWTTPTSAGKAVWAAVSTRNTGDTHHC